MLNQHITPCVQRGPYRPPGHRHRSANRHRPSEPPENHYNPCADYHVSCDSIEDCPKKIDGVKTPPNFWRCMATVARFSRETACYAGVRRLARKMGCCVDTFIDYRKLGEQLGMLGIDPRPGDGSGRKTTLSRPLRPEAGKPNHWRHFGVKAESTFSANLKTSNTVSVSVEQKSVQVQSSEVSQSKSEAKPETVDDQTTTEVIPETPVGPTEAHALQAGLAERFKVLVQVQVCAWILTQLALAKADSVTYVRWLAQNHSPQRAKNKPEILLRWLTGQFIQLVRRDRAQVPVLSNCPLFSILKTSQTAEIRSNGEKPDKPVVDEPPAAPQRIDRERAVEELVFRGLDGESCLEWNWRRYGGPPFPMTLDDLDKIECRWRLWRKSEPAASVP